VKPIGITIGPVVLYLWAGSWSWLPEILKCCHCRNLYWGPFGIEILTPKREERYEDELEAEWLRAHFGKSTNCVEQLLEATDSQPTRIVCSLCEQPVETLNGHFPTCPQPTREADTLTNNDRYALWQAGDHHPDLCDCAGDDWSADGEWCGALEDTFATVARIKADARAAGAADLAAKITALADDLAAERDALREAYRQHNAGRAPDRPRRRPDLDTWANALEVTERKVCAVVREATGTHPPHPDAQPGELTDSGQSDLSITREERQHGKTT
jgi:hypothetical protein